MVTADSGGAADDSSPDFPRHTVLYYNSRRYPAHITILCYSKLPSAPEQAAKNKHVLCRNPGKQDLVGFGLLCVFFILFMHNFSGWHMLNIAKYVRSLCLFSLLMLVLMGAFFHS